MRLAYPRNEPSQSPQEDEKEQVICTFKTAYVFDISQTDGKPLPEFTRVTGDPQEYLQRLERLIAEKGIELKRTDMLAGAEGASTGGTILVKEGLASANEFAVLVHELAHGMLHRDEEGKLRDKKVKETEAEAVTEKDKTFLDTLRQLMESKDLWVELKPGQPSYMVLKGTYGDKIHETFRTSRQGVRWRFQRLFNHIYVEAFLAILMIEKTSGTELRNYAMRISKERYEARREVIEHGS